MNIFIKLLLFCVIFIRSIVPAFSHPLDISVTSANIKEKNITLTTYLHSYEVEYLLRKNKINPDGVDDYFKHKDVILKYIQENIIFKNNNKKCLFTQLEMITDPAYIILTDGLGIKSNIQCSETITDFTMTMNLFLEFPLQTNRVLVYDLQKVSANISPVITKVLTVKIASFSFIMGEIAEKQLDSDNDGLSDQAELIYQTDPNNADTDGDYYSDTEEAEYGWDPLNPELGPGQILRVAEDLEAENTNVFSTQYLVDKQVRNSNLSDYGSGNGVLKDIMKKINDYFEKSDGTIGGLLGFIFLLGMIHTLGPGHSKSLLVAYTLEKENGYRKGIVYAGIFTLTHILDIVILFVVVAWLSGYIDIGAYNYYIQLGAAWGLLVLGIYLLYRAIKRKKCCQKEPEKMSLGLAFLSGLAPCSFAWSLFLLLGAIGKSNFILPFILALGAGIFVSLVGIVILSVFIKEKIYKRANKISEYSIIISALLIVSIGIFMLFGLYL